MENRNFQYVTVVVYFMSLESSTVRYITIVETDVSKRLRTAAFRSFEPFCLYSVSTSSLHIESTDSMINQTCCYIYLLCVAVKLGSVLISSCASLTPLL